MKIATFNVNGADEVPSGYLMSFGQDQPNYIRRAVVYVDKILRGANPADLPVEQPTKLKLVLNLKTAKALGLTFPPTLMVSANEVIECKAVEPAEGRALMATQTQQYVQLLTKRYHLCLKRLSRPEEVDDHPLEQIQELEHPEFMARFGPSRQADGICDRDS